MKIRKRFWDASFYFVQLDTGKGDRVMGSSPGLVKGAISDGRSTVVL